MSLQTDLIFNEEMEKLTQKWTDMESKAKIVEDFIFDFDQDPLDKPKDLAQKFGSFQRSLVTLTGTYVPHLASPAVVSLSSNLEQGNLQSESPMQQQQIGGSSKISLVKVLIAVGAMIFGYAAVEKEWISPNFFYMFLVATVILMFLPQAVSSVRSLLSRTSKEEFAVVPPRQLEEWILSSLTEMRMRYFAIRKLVQIVPVRKDTELEKLAFFFSDKLNEIVNQCNNNIWERKTTIVAAIVQSKQASAMHRGGSYGRGQ